MGNHTGNVALTTSGQKLLDVLLVEDSAADAFLVTKLIDVSGVSADVRVVSDGETALDYLHGRGVYSAARAPDCVLLDLNLPRKNGFEVLEEIRRNPPLAELPVFILTSSKNSEDIARARELNASKFITKPGDLDEFEAVLKHLLLEDLPQLSLPEPTSKERPKGGEAAPRGHLGGQQLPSFVDSFVDSVVDYAILMIDPNGYILTWNLGAERINGYRTSEVIGKHFSIFYPREANAEHHPAYELGKARAEGRYQEEGWRVRKDGTLFWADVTITPVQDDKGELVGFSKVIRDLTETRERELALKRTQRFVQLLKIVASASSRNYEPDEFLRFCLDRVCNETQWEVGHAFFVSEADPDLLVPTDIWHMTDPERFRVFRELTVSSIFHRGVGLPGQVYERGESVWIPDLLADPNFPRARIAADIGVRSGFGCPILVDNKIIGVLEFFSSSVSEPDDSLIEVMDHIGKQLGQVYQRKRSDEALRETERRNRLILEKTYDAFVAMDQNGAITDWNPMAEKIFGWSKQEIVGRTLSNTIIPAKHREAHLQGLAKFLRTGEGPILGKRLELSALRRDGQEFPVELTVTPISVKGGFVFGAFLHDISDRKRSEELLRKSEERYRRLLDSALDIVWTASLDGLIQSLNPAFETITGWPREEWIGRSYAPLIHQEDAADLASALATVAQGKIPPMLETRILNSQGRHWHAESLIRPVWEGGKVVGVFALIRDVSRRKESEAALRRAHDTLEQQVKERTAQLRQANADLARSNAELQQFAYIASHDLQEPLRAIAMYVQLLERRNRERLGDEDLQYIDLVIDGAHRMKALIEDLLTFARIGRFQDRIRPFDLSKAVVEAKANLKALISEMDARVTATRLPTLDVDAVQIVQLFQNLIGNAIKYRSDSPPEVSVSAEERKDDWLFSVKDNGIGINPDYAERIFVVFQRLHSDRKKYPGTGIGLSICKKIIERHGGRIWVESRPGDGATFHFTLPKKVSPE